MSVPSKDDRGLARRFSRAAAAYDRLTGVQRHVAARLDSRLEGLPAPGRVLEVGCGTGHFTRLLRRRFPAARLWAVDLAEAMLRRAQERVPGPGITWIAADVRRELPPGEFDLIAGSSSLHWMTPLEELFPRLRHRLAPGGSLVFALMRAGTLRELQEARRRAAPRKEPRGGLPTTAQVTAALAAAGLEIRALDEETVVHRSRDAAAFLAEIHRQGVTGGVFSRDTPPLTRGELRALVEDYGARFPHPRGGVRATYEVLYARVGAAVGS